MNEYAYKAIKCVNPELNFISAGYAINSGYKYLDELLNYNSYKSCVDVYSFHGKYNTVQKIKETLKTHNVSTEGLINSEAYCYGVYTKGVEKNFKHNDIFMPIDYIKSYKDKLKFVTFFCIPESTPDELRAVKKSGHSYGLFRTFPYIEPRSGAVIAYNLFDIFTNDTAYESEYSFGHQKAVRLKNGDSSVLCVWSSLDEDFTLCSELQSVMTSDTVITDFEGKTADVNMQKSKMYYITGVDESALDSLEQSCDKAINDIYVSPFYDCKDVYGNEGIGYIPDSAIITQGELFDKDTFEINSSAAKYNSLTSYKSDNRFAVSLADDGLYISVDVIDTTPVNDASNAEKLADNDSLTIAIDCCGNLLSNERNEYRAGLIDGEAALYKVFAADPGAEMSDENCSGSKTVLSSDFVDISRNNNMLSYRVFIPAYEMFPISNIYDALSVRFALKIRNFNTNGTVTELNFGDGIEDTTVWKYGVLSFGKISASNDGYTLFVTGVKLTGTDALTISVYRDNSLCYLMQYDDLNDGVYNIRIPNLTEGTYTINVVDDFKKVYSCEYTLE